MHQLVEYLLGAALLSQGLQSARPLVPTILGSVAVLNTTSVKGPLSTFPKVSRAVHRILDVLLVAAIGGAAVLLGNHVDSSVRFILGGIAAGEAFVVWRTDYTTPVRSPRRLSGRLGQAAAGVAAVRAAAAQKAVDAPSTPSATAAGRPDSMSASSGPASAPAPDPAGPPAADRSAVIGQKAGRAAGKLYNAARQRKRP